VGYSASIMIATRMAPLERLKLRLSGPTGHRNDSTYWEIGLFVQATSLKFGTGGCSKVEGRIIDVIFTMTGCRRRVICL
jgi:hypothetical protein